jgi:hypothetical protein
MRKHHSFILKVFILLGLVSLSVMAQPGNGIRLGQSALLTPQLTASYKWDDNVNLRRRAVEEGGDDLEQNDSDTVISAQASLSLQYWNRSSQVNSKIWYNRQRYDTYTVLDKPSYGANVGYFWSRPGANTTLRTDFSYQEAIDRSERSDDFIGDSQLSGELENVSERVERKETRADITLDQQLSSEVRGSLNAGITDVRYKNPRYNDRESRTFSGELNHQWTDKTQPYARAGIGFDEDEGFEDTAEKPFYLIGARHQATAKLDFDIGIGYESYSRTPNEGVDAGNELKDSGIKYTLRMNYELSHKARLSLNGRNGYSSVASPGSSSRKETSASLALTHQTTRQLSQRVSIAWREDDYLSPLPARGELYDELKETIYYQYRVDYQTVRPWLSLYATAAYEDGSSQVPGDSYTQTELSIGLQARY